jgi:hypothetical protein
LITYREKRVTARFSLKSEKENEYKRIFGKRIKNKNSTSPTMRKILGAAIKSQRIVNVNNNDNESTIFSRGEINLNSQEINQGLQQTVNLNPRTWGWGFSFLHEYLHYLGFGDGDPKAAEDNPGSTEDILNKMRRELGPEFGERLYYYRPGSNFIPFDNSALQDINNGSNRLGTPNGNSKYLFIIRPPAFIKSN